MQTLNGRHHDTTGSARFADPEKQISTSNDKSTTITATESHGASSGYAASTAGLTHKVQNRKAERLLLFKLDILVIPLAMLLYLSAYLDRGERTRQRSMILQ